MAFRLVLVLLGALLLTLDSSAAQAQILDRMKARVAETKAAVKDARALRCEVQGECGRVTRSELFSPATYETMAVAVFDATRRMGTPDMLAIARDAFEASLIGHGYLLAASADAASIQARLGASRDAWPDDRLAQLKDFVDGIDAVLVVDIRSVVAGRCTVQRNGRTVGAGEVTVAISVRWLNADVGDIPWVAEHEASVCNVAGRAAYSEALSAAAKQLASSIPARNETR